MRGRLAPEQALQLIRQAGRALDAAHRNDLIHRDVKPANLLIERGEEDDSDHVYLADFGLTKHQLSRSGVTATGQFVGTLAYIAPEQIKGERVDGRADIYSLGCVLYESLTGSVPFIKDAEAAVIWAHVEEQPVAPSTLSGDLPKAFDAVIERALAKCPEDRYATCRELVDAASAAFGSAARRPTHIDERNADCVLVRPRCRFPTARRFSIRLRPSTARRSRVRPRLPTILKLSRKLSRIPQRASRPPALGPPRLRATGLTSGAPPSSPLRVQPLAGRLDPPRQSPRPGGAAGRWPPQRWWW